MHEQTPVEDNHHYTPLTTALVTVATFFGSQILAAFLVTLVPYILGLRGAEATSWHKQNPLASFLLIFITGLINFGIIRWILGRWKVHLTRIGLNKFKPEYIGWALLGFGAYFLLYLVAVGVLSAIVPGLNIEQEQELGFSKAQSGIGLALVFVSLVIIPPLVEEFVMRGFLFTGLRTKLSFYYATLITSVLFAVAHLPAGIGGLLWIGAVDTFVLSIVLCYLRERYKSLWPPIGVHMLKNGLAFTIVFLLGDVIR